MSLPKEIENITLDTIVAKCGNAILYRGPYIGDYVLLNLLNKLKKSDMRLAQHLIKVQKTARIMNRYKQVPHLSQDTKWECNKITLNTTNKRQEVSLFPSGDHKTALNRRKSMTSTRHK